MSNFRDVILPVPADAIIATQDMSDFERKCYMANNHYIPAHHIYGYGVYSGVKIIDETHIGYRVGSSCD